MPLVEKVLEKTMTAFSDRVSKLLYKFAVELCMCEHLLALDTYTHITDDMQRSAAEIVGGFMEELMEEEPA